jgi:hypothetical protein
MGDIDGDGEVEIVISTATRRYSDFGLFAWNNDGTVVNNWPIIESFTPDEYFSYGLISTPSLSDLDQDGKLDISVVGQNGILYVFNIDEEYSPEHDKWPTYRHDESRSGWYDFGILPDNEGPSIEIVEPDGGESISGIVKISVNANDNFAMKNVEFWVCYLDELDCTVPGHYAYLGFDGTSPYSHEWDTSRFRNGSYRIKVVATDYYRNRTEDIVNVSLGNVDEAPPGAPSNLNFEDVSESTIQLIWVESTDNVGVAGYRLYRNDILLRDLSFRTTGYLDSSVDCDSEYWYWLEAYDYVGNVSSPSNTLQVIVYCTGLPTPTPPDTDLLGDLDRDGDVDLDDFNLFIESEEFGNTGLPGFVSVDIDEDGDVDIFDFNILTANFNI